MPNWKKVVVSGSSPDLNNINASSFVKSGGTSAQFLKADGSVDSNTYLTSVGTINLASGVTGTLPVGNGGTGAITFTAGRVLIGNGTSAFTTDSGFTYSSNKLGIDGTITSNTKDIISNASSATILLIGDVDGDDSIEQLDLKAMGVTAISITDSQVAFTSDVGIKISNAPDTTSEDTTLMITSTGDVQKRELGSNAFNSTAFLTSLSGAVLTTGDQTASGTKTFSGTVKLTSAVNAGHDTNKFLVLDTTDKIDFRTGAEVRADIDAAADGANSDITSLSGLTTALSVAQGGTGVTSLDNIQLSSFDDDLDSTYVALTGNQSIAGTKTFTGQIVIGANGTTSVPMIKFPGTSTNTGFYSSNPDEISITIGGSQKVKFAAGTSQFTSHLQAHCLGVGGAPSTTSGEIWAYGDVVANKSSDKRLKKKIKNIPNALEKVSQINGVTFEWKKTNEKMKKEVHSHEGQDVGVIAQEIEEVLPEIVATRDNGYKAVYYEKLVPLLIEAVKELKAEVDELKKTK